MNFEAIYHANQPLGERVRREGAQINLLERVRKINESIYDLETDEQSRLLNGVIRFIVTGEVLPFFGKETDVFCQLLDLKTEWSNHISEEDGHSAPKAEGSPGKERASTPQYNYNNNIYHTIQDNIKNITTSSLKDHHNDNDTMGREKKADFELCEDDGCPWDTGRKPEQDPAEKVIALVEKQCSMVAWESTRQAIRDTVNRYGEALCTLAVERAGKYGGTSWAYILRILKQWESQGIRTEEQARENCIHFEAKRKGYSRGRPKAPTETKRSMYQSHSNTALSDLEREAIRSALSEDWDSYQ